ncbi:MAG: flagellar hook-basal body complex protein FliE [Alphaproteobacteria bacterium]|nr:flagellar hook-basal body complex protein FliE [Alphaproteobacteria bacterium]MCB9928141.1 flagellar hook-basal body complex protein FliE [Alphaproteobacteria bacterium]
MDLNVSRALAGYAAARKNAPPIGEVPDKTTAPKALGAGESVDKTKDFGAVVGDMASEAVGTLRTAEAKSLEGVAGEADVQSVVEAVAAAEMTMRTVVAIRDKVVEAYHDILRMPI